MERRMDQDFIMELFQEYLEGKMVGTVTPDILCGPECFRGPEVGEGGAPDHILLYQGGAVTIRPAGPVDLTSQGLEMYPRDQLSTEHALLVTRALATLHAHILIQQATGKGSSSSSSHQGQENDLDNDVGDREANNPTHIPVNDGEDGKTSSNFSSNNKNRVSANTTTDEETNNNNQHTDDNDDERLSSHDNTGTSNYTGRITDEISRSEGGSSMTSGTNEGRPLVKSGCLKDRWTAQISRLHLAESNLTIMVDALANSLGREERTVGRLEALKSDLPTLTQFLQFSSVMQPTRVPSVGPVLIRDIWIPSQEIEEDVIAIRLRGGNKLDAPPLRDATWVWLTLLGGETLRERYIELCDDYCNAFNKVLLRREASNIVEELSYFDVMRDLGENFLHAFLTIIHKYVVSGTWFFDRGLHTDEGTQSLVDVISFLVDNGIVGSIFVI